LDGFSFVRTKLYLCFQNKCIWSRSFSTNGVVTQSTLKCSNPLSAYIDQFSYRTLCPLFRYLVGSFRGFRSVGVAGSLCISALALLICALGHVIYMVLLGWIVRRTMLLVVDRCIIYIRHCGLILVIRGFVAFGRYSPPGAGLKWALVMPGRMVGCFQSGSNRIQRHTGWDNIPLTISLCVGGCWG